LAAFPKRRRCSTIPWQTTIYPQVEVIPVRQLDEAYQKVLKGEVKFRYTGHHSVPADIAA
jgi:hypothetical protein